jgi:hypothetical protein
MKRFEHVDRATRYRRCRKHRRSRQALVPVYRVGELFLQSHHHWPEGTQITYRPGGIELTLFRRDIEDDLVTDVMSEPAEFAIIVDLPLIILAYRVGNSISWNDVPYSWHLQPVGGREIPPRFYSPEMRILVWISLVGARDGIIHAQRGMTLSPAFTAAIHEAIRAQATSSFSPALCTAAISRLYLQYPDTVDRLLLAVARSKGNE